MDEQPLEEPIFNEAETRKLIDQQLRQAGWIADSTTLAHSKGTRPEKGKNLAIAEWPAGSGFADYVLFIGLTPMAIVEAKRKNTDVSAALEQAKRYSREFVLTPNMSPHVYKWENHAYVIPFVFSSNGRPYLRQLSIKSGIWFSDVRLSQNISRPLDGWYTPDGLNTLLKRDEQAAHQQLNTAPFDYDLKLRHYQQAAIQAAEAAISRGKRSLLLAMATGTGKTKTCIALLYRLLKTQRFRCVLFLVDRSALGEQAADAFQSTRIENLQTFADIFGLKGLKEGEKSLPDSAVHIATVQSMVQRIFNSDEDAVPPTIDQYDCIVIDECHRGYLLDREMSDTEITFRSQEDYISKYRRVLDYFDAVKIGLTATPALHTTEIFGYPIYTYSYRDAVIDGFLVDHEPPIQIVTQLSKEGIVLEAGEEVPVYNTQNNQIELFTLPDQIKFEVEDFNRNVITEAFNRVICEYLAKELDPLSRQKTLIFCANNTHADVVVDLLKQTFQQIHGSIDDDAIIKITGNSDQPLQLIRRYKNEHYPNIAVTVDLLSTGVDVPEICNIVFLRRVNSRILYDQMMGRATRRCPHLNKEIFRVFDAVRLYEILQRVTAMQPVVVNPAIPFSQLIQELLQTPDDEGCSLVRDQFVTKLRRKQHHLNEKATQRFEQLAGMSPEKLCETLKNMTPADVVAWFAQHSELGELLDRKEESRANLLIISQQEDQLVGVERGYGKAIKPDDYLQEFTDFVRNAGNTLPALITVLTRPRELTRKQLRELVLALDEAGFTEANLSIAWRETTNQDIAARIIGFIRRAALGDSLIPYEQRVDNALQKMLSSRSWSEPQRQWLQKIAAQTKVNLLVDREALDDPNFLFKREGGGFQRLNRIFGGELEQILDTFNESLWQSAA